MQLPSRKFAAQAILMTVTERKEGKDMKYQKLTAEEKAKHPSIHYTGSVKGMKEQGYWGKHDKCVRCGSYIYNLSIVAQFPWRR